MKLFIYCSFIFILFITSCSNDIYKSKWQNKEFLSDSINTKIVEPLKYYDEKSKLQFAFSNDNENFYLEFRATEQQTQMKILRAGMQVWFDTTGKKNQQVGVLFPFPHQGQYRKQQNQDGKTQQRPDIKNMMKQNIMELNQLTLTGFKSPMNGVLPLKNQYGIYADINLDSSKIMTYRLVVPFRTFTKSLLSPKDSLRKFSMTVIVKGLSMQGRGGGGGEHHGGGLNGGMHGSGMGGGMRGGGMGGGMRGGGQGGGQYGRGENGNQNSSMSEEDKFVIKFKMSAKSN